MLFQTKFEWGARYSPGWKYPYALVALVCIGFSTPTTPSYASNVLSSQSESLNETVKGKVVDQKGEPLPGVTVLVKGTSTGSVTNLDGTYQLEVPSSTSVLVFSFVGYINQEEIVGKRTQIDIKLAEDTKALEELVVIGYGTAKKADLTGSVARIDATTFQSQPMTQITDMLTGTVAGFQANQGTTASGGSSMEVRGVNSLNASTNPMVVVDGAIYNGAISDINPNDIETIDILKDASSAAVYGARASNGVILVTTKRGKSDKPTINFSTKLGVTEVLNAGVGARDADNYLQYRSDFFRTLGGSQPDYYFLNPNNLPAGVSLDQWRAATSNPNSDNTMEWLSRLNLFPEEIAIYKEKKSVNWADEVFKKGIRQEYDLSVGGRTERLQYYWSVGYQNNEGIIRGDQFSAIRSRLNLDLSVTKWLKVGMNTQFSLRDESTWFNSPSTPIGEMYAVSPFSRVYNTDGSANWFPHGYISANPLIDYKGRDRLNKSNNLFAVLYGEVQLPFGITYRLSYQPRISQTKDYSYWSPLTRMGGETNPNGFASRYDYSSSEWLMDNLLKWNKSIGIHNFDVTLLYNLEQFKSWSSNVNNQGFQPSPNLGYSGLQYGTKPGLSTNDITYGGDGLMARVNYTLLDRYLFTGSIRRDGYSGFGQKNPYAYFPAAAFAWQLHREDFFKSDLVSQWKVRASWGRNGNREIGPYASFAQMGASQYYDGSNTLIGVFTSSLSNSELSWEESESINFGTDIGILRDRISLSADYYISQTKKLLVQRTLPSITGFSQVTTNIGELANQGLELTLNSTNVRKPNFQWKTVVNFSLNRNKINRLFGVTGDYILQGESRNGEIPDYANNWFPGKSIDVVWDYDVDGIWQTSETDAAKVYGLFPGDFKAKDLDGNGAYEALQDKTFIGHTVPRYLLGVRNEFSFLKNFTASIFVRADLGHIRQLPWVTQDYSSYDRRSTPKFDYWTPENGQNEYPRLANNRTPFGGGIELYKPSGFVRVQDVSLSYGVPSEVSKKIGLDNLRVYGSIRNAMTFTKWPGWDPESGLNPMPRTFTVGLSLTL